MLVPTFAGGDGFGGTQELCEPVEGKGWEGAKSSSSSFPTEISFISQNKVGCFLSSLFFPLGGVIVYQLQCQNVPDLIYVPLA